MNTETGEIYRGQLAIEAALERGEPVVSVSEQVAQMMEIGRTARSPLSMFTTGQADLSEVNARLDRLEKRLGPEQGLIIHPSPEDIRQYAP